MEEEMEEADHLTMLPAVLEERNQDFLVDSVSLDLVEARSLCLEDSTLEVNCHLVEEMVEEDHLTMLPAALED